MEAEQRICRRCGREFTDSATLLCPICYTPDEEAFVKVRDYLRDFPGRKAEEVCEATGVPTRIIRKFLRQERLEIVGNVDTQLFLSCVKCGAPIKSGHYCDKCHSAGNAGAGVKNAGKNIGRAAAKPPAVVNKKDEELEIMLEKAKIQYAATKRSQGKLHFKD